jgi:hypothetical protein
MLCCQNRVVVDAGEDSLAHNMAFLHSVASRPFARVVIPAQAGIQRARQDPAKPAKRSSFSALRFGNFVRQCKGQY